MDYCLNIILSPSSYWVLAGNKKSTRIYKIMDHVYVSDMNAKDKRYLRCQKSYLQSCRARAVMSRDTLQVLSMTHGHTCNGDPLETRAVVLKKEMKRLAETTATGLHDIFQSVSMKDPEAAARISWDRLQPALQERRNGFMK